MPLYKPPVPFSPFVSTAEGPFQYPAGGPFAGWQVAGMTLTSAQILALNSTPVTLIPAPATGYFLMPQYAVLRYDYGGTAYAGTTGVLQFLVGTANIDPATASGALLTFSTANIGATASSIETVTLVTASASSAAPPTTALAAQAMTVQLSAANATTGNGTLHITVFYNTEPTS